MQYDFLKQFSDRMKHVGMYTLILKNSMQKQVWKQYGIETVDEQINLIFMLLMYIMEQSLKEENCTMDDICVYLDDVNRAYFHKGISYEECRELGNFMINTILSNEGKEMLFACMEPEVKEYRSEHIRFIANKIVYLDNGVKRTSYYLTDEGYNLLLSTLEIEKSMQLTIHEMIFKMQLEKQSYDKALDEVKKMFNSLRIQLQKIQESMLQIRRNALNYSTKDYDNLQIENMDTIADTKKRFQGYRETVIQKVKELEERGIHIEKLSEEEEEKLGSLRQIEGYLNRSIDEHQKILNSHFDLKTLYEKQLEMLSQMSRIKRFSFRDEIYDKVLEQPENLDNLDFFLRPLFHNELASIYNPEKSLSLQRPIRKKQEEDEAEIMNFDGEEYERELEARKRALLKLYEDSLRELLLLILKNEGKMELSKLTAISGERLQTILPRVGVFKEIMVELIKIGHISIEEIQKEKSEFIQETSLDFQLQEMLLEIIEKEEVLKPIKDIYIHRLLHKPSVVFEHVMDEAGAEKVIRCSEVMFELL